MSKEQDFFQVGLKLRQQMFGEQNTNDSFATATDFTQPVQEMVTRFCFGEVWNRPHLDRKTRSMLTIASVMTQGRTVQLKSHVKGAIENGVTKDELREVLMHVMLYAGLPKTMESFAAAAEALKEIGLD